MTSLSILITVLTIYSASCFDLNKFLGCYKTQPGTNLTQIDNNFGENSCIDICSKKFFRYAWAQVSNQCMCGNYLGDLHDKNFCNVTCDNCEQKAALYDVFAASDLVVGPPRNFRAGNVTNITVHFTWDEPESFVNIDSYKINAKVLKTYSTNQLVNPEWTFSNTDTAEIVNLHPATTYNFTLQGVPTEGKGAVVWQVVETKIGEPDFIPEVPKVTRREKSKVFLELKNVTNNNGPITSYLIIVVNLNSVQTFDSNNLRSYKEALHSGITYYITAEIPSQSVSKHFTVGDGRMYGKYYNAILEPNTDYTFILGVKSESRKDNITYIVYSNNTEMYHDVVVQVMNVDGEDSPALIIVLSVAIGLLSLILIASLIAFVILRNRILHRNRQRLNDNQELTFQGPMISMENNAYVPEDEMIPANHYDNLNQQVWIIPRNLLTIQQTSPLGMGKFGMVHGGTVSKDNVLRTVAVYSIADRKLDPADKRVMLKDLDILIRAEKHENVLELIGTCESLDTVCVVLEYVSTNLKELLLGCRNNSPGSFCNITSSQLLDIAINICKGMAHLESKNIVHKQLCARNISIINGFTPKISGFGLAQYYENNATPIYTRWTAKEVFRGQLHVSRSDIWSFACVLWEICALGGTPYGNVPNSDIPDKVLRNQVLKQLQYVGENLYQVMLNCWQIDLDERPSFSELIENLLEVKEDRYVVGLSLNSYPGFQYEQYYPSLELSGS